MSVDLHTHTVHSDGTTTPSENAALAAAAGLTGLALTDHDTTAGWAEAAEACARHGLDFVPGIELSAEDHEHSVHLLGYWVDAEDPALAAECARLRAERESRADRILELLADLGVHVDSAAVRTHAAGAPIGRPHIAAAMVDAGIVPDIGAAFDRYLADGGPAWYPKHALAPEDGVRLITSAGGAAVLAHPGTDATRVVETTALVRRLRDVGLSGVEAEHAGHGPATVAYWTDVARGHGLLVTGSSDFHGERKDVRLGAATTPAGVVAALAERAGRAMAPVTAGGRVRW